ncbi:hypothetical protein DZF79_28590 [Vibrio parahaemolyticus]|nr:hypothetical protein [Vibrio parahaemolyticus]
MLGKDKELQDHQDARVKKIIEPQNAELGFSFDRWVTVDSPTWQRLPIVQLRRYLGIECDYGMNFNSFDECWKDLEVLTLTDSFYDEDVGSFRNRVFGAVCMRRDNGQVFLEWAWVHPFWRNKGVLAGAWGEIIERFEEGFFVRTPVSATMSGFLRKVGHIDSITNPSLFQMPNS